MDGHRQADTFKTAADRYVRFSRVGIYGACARSWAGSQGGCESVGAAGIGMGMGEMRIRRGEEGMGEIKISRGGVG